MNYKKYLVSLAAMALAVAMTACGTVDKILSEVDNKNYDEALDIYDSKDLKDKDIDKLSEELETRINTCVDAYAKNEITYDELQELLSFVNEIDLDELEELVAEVSTRVNDLKTSKDYFEQAKSYYDEEQYDTAYGYFSYVIEDDGYYAEAQDYMEKSVTAYCDAVQAKADEYIKKEDYDGAISYLSSAKYSAYFSEEAAERIGEIEESVRIQNIISKAKEKVDSGDTVGALEYIASARESYSFKNDTELDNYVKEISKEYVDKVMEKVEAAKKDENYMVALQLLKDAQKVVDDETFDKEIEEIDKIRPAYLDLDIKTSTSARFEAVTEGDPINDSVGNSYEPGNLFTISAASGWSNEEGNAKFYLNRNYGPMTGTIAVSDTTENDAHAVISIIGDGNVLFSQELNRTTTPINIAINVSEYEWLEITMTEADGGTTSAILSNFRFGKPTDATPATEATTEASTEDTTAEGETTAAEGETTAAEDETTAAEGETTAAEGETTAAEDETTAAETTGNA